MNESALHELPGGWVWAYLDDISLKITDGEHIRPKIILSGVPFLSAKDVKDEGILFDDAFCVTEDDAKKFRNRCDPEIGDVLIVSRGATVGRSCIVNIDRKFCLLGSVILIKLDSKVSNKFIAYVIKSANIQKALIGLSGSTAQQAIYIRDIRKILIPLPPLPEQRRIVTKLEELFTRLDAGVSELKKTQAQLKRYRQSVLKAACEGKLVPTEAGLAKDEGREYETAEVLLARIVKEKRERSSKNAKYKEPVTPDINGLNALPEGWKWINLDQITWSVRDGPHYSPKYVKEGIPFISGGNVRPNGIDFTNAKRITPELHSELSNRCKPEKGDILYTKGGTTGIARVNTYDFEFNVWVHVAVLKLAGPVEPFYIQHALNSQFCYAQSQRFTHGVGNQDLGLTRMVNIMLGFPPLAEQRRIVAEVERRLSIADGVEKTVTQSLAQAQRLRQSILKKAFEGRLVAQDASDEPAGVLLERIKQEKERMGEKKRKR